MKKIFSLIAIAVFYIFSNELSAQQLTPPQQAAVNKLFKSSDLAYYKFKVHSLSEIPQFAKTMSIDKHEGALVYAHATKAQFSQFIRINYAYTVIPHSATKKKTTKVAPKKTVKKK
jgi:hypothetical protein